MAIFSYFESLTAERRLLDWIKKNKHKKQNPLNHERNEIKIAADIGRRGGQTKQTQKKREKRKKEKNTTTVVMQWVEKRVLLYVCACLELPFMNCGNVIGIADCWQWIRIAEQMIRLMGDSPPPPSPYCAHRNADAHSSSVSSRRRRNK